MGFVNPSLVDPQAFTSVVLGFRVDRATATLPTSAQGALFTIAGGAIALTGIVGEVTTVIQTQACNTSLVVNPTTGADLAICAVLDISADPVGLRYGITGIFGDALVGAGTAVVLPQRHVVIPAGTLDILTAATNTGSVKWTLWYIPLDVGATVAAA